jgi:uncharacterized protein (DUF1015 family)
LATLKPFKALRPMAKLAEQVSCAPYDVVDDTEARQQVAGNNLSFLRVTRSETEFPVDSHPSADEVFSRARQDLEWFIGERIYSTDPQEAYYIYQLSSGDHTQTGVVGCCSLDEYEIGIIKKHENVRPDKVEDRTRHLLEVRAQTGLIFLAFRNTETIHRLIENAVEAEPIYRFGKPDGVMQAVWRVTDTQPWEDAFAEVPAFYIADGHHRIESALKARNELRAADSDYTGEEQYNFVLAGLFPAEDLRILPYNRVVRDMNGLDRDEFFARLADNFIVTETGEKVPQLHGEVDMYYDGRWYKLHFVERWERAPNPIERLDVSILQTYLLEPVLGIQDPTTDKRIGFVGGAKGTQELERLVDTGKAKVAFSMYPTTMDDLLAVSDMGGTMPPKSTWFEPKLKDGLLVHMIDNGQG